MRQEGEPRDKRRQVETIGENHETRETESIKRTSKDIKKHKTTTITKRRKGPWKESSDLGEHTNEYSKKYYLILLKA